MRVPCKRCMARMQFPFFKCPDCGWEPEGAMRDRAVKLAEKYIKKHPEDETRLRILLEENMGIRHPGEVARMVGSADMEVPCQECGSNMMFPFMRCNDCGWVPKGGLRKKAIRFAKLYIKKHPEQERQLRFILEEEARETLHQKE